MLLEASDPEIFAVKVEVYFYFEMEEVVVAKSCGQKMKLTKQDTSINAICWSKLCKSVQVRACAPEGAVRRSETELGRASVGRQ